MLTQMHIKVSNRIWLASAGLALVLLSHRSNPGWSHPVMLLDVSLSWFEFLAATTVIGSLINIAYAIAHLQAYAGGKHFDAIARQVIRQRSDESALLGQVRQALPLGHFAPQGLSEIGQLRSDKCLGPSRGGLRYTPVSQRQRAENDVASEVGIKGCLVLATDPIINVVGRIAHPHFNLSLKADVAEVLIFN